MFKAVLSLLLGFFVLIICEYSALADSCPRGRYIYSSGIACTLNTRPGEWVTVVATYIEGKSVQQSDYAVIVVPSTGQRRTVRPNQTIRFEYLASSSREQIRYEIPAYDDTDHVYVGVDTYRTNLKMGNVWMDKASGDIYLNYGVGPEAVFMPTARVCIDIWYTANGKPTTFVAEQCLDKCAGKKNCIAQETIQRSQRPPMKIGENGLVALIDPHNRHPETTSDDNRDYRVVDDFFVEKIPDIMTRLPVSKYGLGWNMPSSVMSFWFRPKPEKESPPASKLDDLVQQLDNIVFFNVDWVLDTRNANNSTFYVDSFNEAVRKSYALSDNAQKLLFDRVRNNLKNTTRKLIYLATVEDRVSNFRQYHQQYIQRYPVDVWMPDDAVGGALGKWSYYLVPIGTARDMGREIRIEVEGVAVHIADAFEFRGEQFLGCWDVPDYLSLSLAEYLSRTCLRGSWVQNPNFNYYRNLKKVGRDFAILTHPKKYFFSTPEVYTIRK